MQDRSTEPTTPLVVPRIVAVCNQGGGVAKTTTCVNLATGLAAAGLRVMVLDLDAQGGATRALGADPGAGGSYELLAGECGKAEAAVRSAVYGIVVVPATPASRRSRLEPRIAALGAADLRARLTEVDAPVDVVVIDCPAGTTAPGTAAMAVADLILIPVQPTDDGIAGLDATVTAVTELGELHAGGVAVLLTRLGHPEGSAAAVDLVRSRYGGFLLPMAIPDDPDHGAAQPLLAFSPDGPAANAYWRLTVAVLRLLLPFLPAQVAAAPVAPLTAVTMEAVAPVAAPVSPAQAPEKPRAGKPAHQHPKPGPLMAAGLVGLVLGGVLAVMAARFTGMDLARLAGPSAPAAATVTSAPASLPRKPDPWCGQVDDIEK